MDFIYLFGSLKIVAPMNRMHKISIRVIWMFLSIVTICSRAYASDQTGFVSSVDSVVAECDIDSVLPVHRADYQETVHKKEPLGMLPCDRKFYLKDFITSPKDVVVYMNGTRLAPDMYDIFQYHNMIMLKDSLEVQDGAIFTCDYITKERDFVLTPTFRGANFVELPSFGGRKQFDLNGIDTCSHTENNYNITYHGFRPMSFIVEGYPSVVVPDSIRYHDSVDYKGYLIELADDPSPIVSVDTARVLHFKHGEVDLDADGLSMRIENVVSRHIKANKVVSDVEFYLPSSIKGNGFKDSAIEWFTIQEYWEGRSPELVWLTTENRGVYDDTERRITLSFFKKAGDERLRYKLTLQDVCISTSSVKKENSIEWLLDGVYVEFDKWIPLHVEILAGNGNMGQVIVRIGDEYAGGRTFNLYARTVCEARCDYANTMRPVFEDFSVMKLYTSKNYIRNGAFGYSEISTDYESGCNRKESNVEIYFRNCRVECTSAVDDLDLGR